MDDDDDMSAVKSIAIENVTDCSDSPDIKHPAHHINDKTEDVTTDIWKRRDKIYENVHVTYQTRDEEFQAQVPLSSCQPQSSFVSSQTCIDNLTSDAGNCTQQSDQSNDCYGLNHEIPCESGACHEFDSHSDLAKSSHSGRKPRTHICKVCNRAFSQRCHLVEHKRIHTGERPYECMQCNKTFSRQRTLNTHVSTHTAENPYMCQLCYKSFKRQESLTLHVHSVCNKLLGDHHQSGPTYVCNVCNKSFNRLSALTRHLHTHTADRPYVCTICNKAFRDLRHLNLHQLTHTGKGRYVCTVCNKSFMWRSHLARHVRTHTLKPRYICTVCNKGFSEADNLNRHIHSHTDGSRYESSATSTRSANRDVNYESNMQCNLPYRRSDDDGHVMSRGTDQGTRLQQLDIYECTYKSKISDPAVSKCNSETTGSVENPCECDACREFDKRVSGGSQNEKERKPKTHICEVCNRAFSQRSHLVEHKRIHSGERPYECVQCNKTFSRQRTLNTHMQTLTDGKPYLCPLCKKAFKRPDSLKLHMQFPCKKVSANDHHSSGPSHVCSVCNKRFKWPSHLTRHLLTHTAEKTYLCTVCNKTFRHLRNLNLHNCTRTGNGSFVCAVCNKSFISQSTLSRHVHCHPDNSTYESNAASTLSENGEVEYEDDVLCDQLSRHSDDDRPVMSRDTDQDITLGQLDIDQVRQTVHVVKKQKQLQLPGPQLLWSAEVLLWSSSVPSFSSQRRTHNVTMNSFNCDQRTDSNGVDLEIPSESDAYHELESNNVLGEQQEILTLRIRSVCDKASANDNCPSGPYHVCTVCNKRFRWPSHLARHLRTHTAKKPYSCTVFNKAFCDIQYLAIHERNHTDKEPYICTVCNKSFIWQSHLARHIGTHSVEKTYVCSVCSKGFSSRASLNAHIVRNHIGGSRQKGAYETSNTVTSNESNDVNVEEDAECSMLSRHSDDDGHMMSRGTDQGIRIKQLDIDNCTHNSESCRPEVSSCNSETPEIVEKPCECDACRQLEEVITEHSLSHSGQKANTHMHEVCNKACSQLNRLNEHKHTPTDERPYKCTECNKGFSSQCILNMHMHTHTDDKPYICPLCCKGFKRQDNLALHIRSVCDKASTNDQHLSESSYDCSECNKRFCRPSHLTRHLRIHTTEKPYVCTVCKKAFRDLRYLTIHKHTHTNDGRYVCTVCNKSFNWQSHLARHIGTHTVVKPYVCSVCHKGFSRQNSLNKHITCNHARPQIDIYETNATTINSNGNSGVKEEYVQSSVLSGPSDDDGYVMSRGTDQGTRLQQLDIDECTYKSKISQAVSIHSGNETKDRVAAYLESHDSLARQTHSHSVHKPEPRISAVDNEAFWPSHQVNEHESTHTAERPYRCTECDKTFCKQYVLETHMRTHIDNKPYVCLLCNKAFSRQLSLMSHIRSVCNKGFFNDHHLSEQKHVVPGDPSCVCTVCNKSFKWPSHLTRHLHTHTAEKPYVCTVCNKAFRDNRNRSLHERTHTNDRPYVCTVCDKSFTWKSHVTRHMETHARSRPS